MKRSEAITKLTNILLNAPTIYGDHTPESVEYVLTELEKMGIMPPIDPSTQDAYGNAKNQWEDEYNKELSFDKNDLIETLREYPELLVDVTKHWRPS